MSIAEFNEGGYVFLSHSHKDIEKVREIRNQFEVEGFEPLCFYLKCLNEDDEIEGLIKREIDVRECFVFIDSPNARKSSWVTKEREYVKSLRNKKIVYIDLYETDIMRAVNNIMNNLRVFISFSNKDIALVERIKDTLVSKDLKVLWDRDVPAGQLIKTAVEELIDTACEKGCLLVIVSKASMNSTFILEELAISREKHGMIIPVMVGIDPKKDTLAPALQQYIADIQVICLSAAPDQNELERLAAAVNLTLRKQGSCYLSRMDQPRSGE